MGVAQNTAHRGPTSKVAQHSVFIAARVSLQRSSASTGGCIGEDAAFNGGFA